MRKAWIGLLLLLSVEPVLATQRIALVVGNGRYASAPLSNPVNDARLIRDTLKSLDFKVHYLENADRRSMIRGLQALGKDLDAADRDSVGLFYFSGHGVQSEGRNYLLPVGGLIETEADLAPEAVNAEWVLSQMEQAGNSLNILILDACRNNTLAASSKSATRGLARMVAPVGSVLAFATDSGTVAYDGDGGNSPYAAALARHMRQPGIELKDMFDRVAREVYAGTQRKAVPQVPVQLYKLTPRFYFKPSPAPAPVPNPVPALTQPLSPPSPPASGGATLRELERAAGQLFSEKGLYRSASQAYRDAAEQGSVIAKAQLAMALSADTATADSVVLPDRERGRRLVEEIMPALRALSAEGRGDAARALGDIAWIVREDYDAAMPHYQRAVQLGNVYAHSDVGYLYGDTRWKHADPAKGIAWFRKGVAKGDPVSAYGLGDAYRWGDGVEKNMREAERWYRHAAESGYASAWLELGALSLDEFEKPAEAYEYFKKAVDLGVTFGLVLMGDYYEAGHGGANGHAEALRWYRKAADLNDAYAHYLIGELYREGGEGLNADPVEAIRWYQSAASLGDASAYGAIARMYRYGSGVNKDGSQALIWYRKAAEAGDSYSAYVIGGAYEKGDLGLQRSRTQAVAWYRRSVQLSADISDSLAAKALQRLGEPVAN